MALRLSPAHNCAVNPAREAPGFVRAKNCATMTFQRLTAFSGLLLMTMTGQTANLPQTNEAGVRLLTDFSAATDLGWYVLNDNVMGGRSEGDFALTSGGLAFSGSTNTNGGGFSSIRTSEVDLDLSGYAGIRLRLKGDGRRYTWRLATDARWRGRQVGYWAEFETLENSWTTVDLPFSAFEPKFRGYMLDGPALDPARIAGMGLMIYDKRDGAFDVHLKSVSGYPSVAPFSLADYQWKKRLLILSAPAATDENLKEQLQRVAATRGDFDERHMTLIVAVDGATFPEADRLLAASQARSVRETLGIEPDGFALRLVGKDGSVKYAASRSVSMADIYALIDTMPMRQRE